VLYLFCLDYKAVLRNVYLIRVHVAEHVAHDVDLDIVDVMQHIVSNV
jgi:hypothetical protein